MYLTEKELYDALMKLGWRIEACGASPELTHAVTLCSDIRAAVGDQYNRPDAHAADRVKAAKN